MIADENEKKDRTSYDGQIQKLENDRITCRTVGLVLVFFFFFSGMMRFCQILLICCILCLQVSLIFPFTVRKSFLQTSTRVRLWNFQINALKKGIDPLDQIKNRKVPINKTSRQDKTQSSVPNNLSNRPTKQAMIKPEDIPDLQPSSQPPISQENIALTLEKLKEDISKTLPQKLLVSFINDALFSRLWSFVLYDTFVFASLLLWLGYFAHQPSSPISNLDVTEYLILLPMQWSLPFFIIQRWQNGYDDFPFFFEELSNYIKQQKKNAEISLHQEKDQLLSIITLQNNKDNRLSVASANRLASISIISEIDPSDMFQQVISIRGVNPLEAIRNDNITKSINFDDLQKLKEILSNQNNNTKVM